MYELWYTLELHIVLNNTIINNLQIKQSVELMVLVLVRFRWFYVCTSNDGIGILCY